MAGEFKGQPLVVSDQTLELAYAANTADTAFKQATAAFESALSAYEVSDMLVPDSLYDTLRTERSKFHDVFDAISYEALIAIDAEWMQWQQCSAETGSVSEPANLGSF